MALTTLNALKISMGIPLTDTTLDTQLTAYVAAAIGVVKKWCRRDFSSTTYTEYHSGDGRSKLLTRQRPAASITSINVDPYGAWGQKAGRFAADTLLTSGDDYALVMDGNGVSESGIIVRCGVPTFSGYVGGIVYPSGIRQGTLSGWDRGMVWPTGDGNIKLVYATTFTVPADLQEATNLIAKQLKAMQGVGLPMSQESYIDYSYALLMAPKSLLTDVKSILSGYVERPM